MLCAMIITNIKKVIANPVEETTIDLVLLELKNQL